MKRGTVVEVLQLGGKWRIKFTPRGLPKSTSALADAYDMKASPPKKAYNVEGTKGDDIHLDYKEIGGKAGEVHAHPLIWKADEAPKAEPTGWDRLTKEADWVRAHLVNARLGGPGVRWNLTPTPSNVNNPGMYRGHEETLHGEVQAGKRMLWISVKVAYHDDAGAGPIGKASDFPREISVEYGETELEGDVWKHKGTLGRKPYKVRPPRPDELLPNRQYH